MKNILGTIAALTLASASSLAATNLNNCNGSFLISAFSEAQPQLNSIVLQSLADGVLTLKSYNPKVGPYAIYGLDAASAQRSTEALQLMQSLQQLQGAIVECNSGLVLN